MKNILLTLSNLDGYQGSVIYVAEIAKYLISKDYNVDLCCINKDWQYEDFFNKMGVKVFTTDTIDLTTNYCYVFSIHYPVLSKLLLNGLKYQKIIPFNLSSFLSIESPPTYYKELNKIVSISNEAKNAMVENYNIESNKIQVYPNFVPEEYFQKDKKNHSQIVKNVIIVSNHVPKELEALSKLLKKSNIKCTIYGQKHNYQQITPDLLLEADVIISIGKTVQYGLSLGIPIYNYDHFGGSGYITLNNIDKEEYYNFSGRSFFTKKDAKTIFNEIVTNYADVLKDVEHLKEIAKERYYVPTKIDEIMKNSVHTNVDIEKNLLQLKKDELLTTYMQASFISISGKNVFLKYFYFKFNSLLNKNKIHYFLIKKEKLKNFIEYKYKTKWWYKYVKRFI